MARHIFLTGEKRVGKSTLILRYLAEHPCRVGGFQTIKTREVFMDRDSVHLIRPGAEAPSRENLLFFCGDLVDGAVRERFDRLGSAALRDLAAYELILMDELGPAEADAPLFQQAVFEALEQETPVLGVMQRADTPFLRQIARHPQVRVLEVTPENRDDLCRELAFPRR